MVYVHGFVAPALLVAAFTNNLGAATAAGLISIVALVLHSRRARIEQRKEV